MRNELTGQIAFASGKTGDYDIWTLDVASGQLQQITSGQHWNDKPAWSPDGRWIAFTSNRTGFPEIYKAPAGGGDAMQLTDLERWCDSPRFSPDGTKIAFVSNEAGNNDIWVMDADGQNRQQITQHDGSDTHVEWTPNGQGLLWSSDRDNNDSDIWHWSFTLDRQTQLTTEHGADINPVPSPCAELVAFVSNRQAQQNADRPFEDRDKDIWLMAADGSHPVRLTDSQGCDFCACWSPNGQYILYTSNQGRQECRLRVMDVSGVVAAFATGDPQAIERAADKIRSEAITMDREPLQEEIGAVRHTTFVTRLLPQNWVQSCYPAGYFGQERYPHWTSAPAVAQQHDEQQTETMQTV